MRASRTTAGIGALVLAAAFAASAEELEPRGEITLGARLYLLDSSLDDEGQTSFFDQYRYIATADDDPAWFVDALHTDLGLARDDDTHLLRFERWSPGWLHERGLLDADWRGLDLEAEYRRFRWSELRVYPIDSRTAAQLAGVPPPATNGFGTFYHLETDDPAGVDEELFVRRTSVGGRLGVRPDGFGTELPGIAEVGLRSRYEHRSGYRQDRFLLDESEVPFFPDQTDRRWRGSRRRLDQDVTSAGADAVTRALGPVTTAFHFDYERFREDAAPVTLDDVAAASQGCDGRLCRPIVNFDLADPRTAARAVRFVPDTDRYTGSFRSSARLGPARLNLGGFVTHLEQAGRQAPLQQLAGLEDNAITTWSTSGGFDVPLVERAGAAGALSLGGFFHVVERHADLDENAFASVPIDGDGPASPFQRRRREITSGAELAARPAAGSLLALGYRNRFVDRQLRFGDARYDVAIPASRALIREESETHTAYVRGRARLLRTLRVSGELGYAWSPEIGLPRELEEAVTFEGRGSYAWFRPVPLTLSVFGRVRDGEGDDFRLGSSDPGLPEQEKSFDRTRWSYGLSASAVPRDPLVLFASFVQGRDTQEWAYVRSDQARTSPFVDFFLDSRPEYESEFWSLAAGGTWHVTPRVELSATTSWTWVRARFPDASPGTSDTADVLERADALRSRIWSVEGRVGYQVRDGLHLGLGYRFDDYRDRRDVETGALGVRFPEAGGLELDDRVHTVTLAVTLELDRFWR